MKEQEMMNYGGDILKELQEYLIQNPSINNSDILPISVTHPVLEESLRKKLRISAKNRASEKKASKKTDGYRKKYEIAFRTRLNEDLENDSCLFTVGNIQFTCSREDDHQLRK